MQDVAIKFEVIDLFNKKFCCNKLQGIGHYFTELIAIDCK